MRYNDRRFSIEGGAGLMGKYQLKSRKEGSVIMSKLMIKMLLSKR